MLLFFILLVPTLLLIYHLLTKKYLNPYKLIFVFGKKGSGKSTLLAKYAFKYKSKGWHVYSTENIPNTFKIRYQDIGFYHFPENSCIIVDEVGMIWDNRNFKSFKPEVRDFFKLQRHYKCCVILASQTFDVDKKIRDLADEMYLVKKSFRVFSYAKRILRKTVLVKASAEAPSKIDEDLVFDSIFLFWAGSRKFTFIPKWSIWFDSFNTPQLKQRSFDITPVDTKIMFKRYYKRKFVKRRRRSALFYRLFVSLLHFFRSHRPTGKGA